MSAYALIIGLPHETDAPPVVISGPEFSYQEQREKFKQDFMTARSHKKFRLVHLLDSRRGVRKRKSFITPEEEKRRKKALAGQEKEFSAARVQDSPEPSETQTQETAADLEIESEGDPPTE